MNDRMDNIERWDGETLYAEWCNASGSDREAYYRAMNPADRYAWVRLAKVVNAREADWGAVDALRELLDALGDAPSLPNDQTWQL